MTSNNQELCVIKCPSCGERESKSLNWLNKHETYICSCGEKVEARNIFMQEEIEKVDKEIKKLES